MDWDLISDQVMADVDDNLEKFWPKNYTERKCERKNLGFLKDYLESTRKQPDQWKPLFKFLNTNLANPERRKILETHHTERK